MRDISNITTEKDGDIIFVTVAKYKLFLSYGSIGMDAYCIYSHMMFTARLQETNQIYSNDSYLRGGMNWGRSRVQKAKQLLIELGLIEEITKRDEKTGKFVGKYVKVKTKKTPFEIEDIVYPCVSNPSDGSAVSRSETTNALTNNINALTKKGNAENKFIPPTKQQIQQYVIEKDLNVDVDFFYNYFTAGNWYDSNNNKVKNWKQKLITWHNHNHTKKQDYNQIPDQAEIERQRKKYVDKN